MLKKLAAFEMREAGASAEQQRCRSESNPDRELPRPGAAV
jgi:hypothetical protein